MSSPNIESLGDIPFFCLICLLFVSLFFQIFCFNFYPLPSPSSGYLVQRLIDAGIEVHPRKSFVAHLSVFKYSPEQRERKYFWPCNSHEPKCFPHYYRESRFVSDLKIINIPRHIFQAVYLFGLAFLFTQVFLFLMRHVMGFNFYK